MWVIDSTNINASQHFESLREKILPHCTGKKLIIVLNKSDLSNSNAFADDNATTNVADATGAISHTANISEFIQNIHAEGYDIISISAKNKIGIAELQTKLIEAAALPEISQNDVVVTNIRHYEALSKALESIQRVEDGMAMNLSGDFISQDLRECLFHLAEIVGGEITTDEVLGNIFKNFCIGK